MSRFDEGENCGENLLPRFALFLRTIPLVSNLTRQGSRHLSRMPITDKKKHNR